MSLKDFREICSKGDVIRVDSDDGSIPPGYFLITAVEEKSIGVERISKDEAYRRAGLDPPHSHRPDADKTFGQPHHGH